MKTGRAGYTIACYGSSGFFIYSPKTIDMKATTRQINKTGDRQVSQTNERSRKVTPASQHQEPSFARQAYSGNFFAGPHSIFDPRLFRETKLKK
jgi:hypothetical protein